MFQLLEFLASQFGSAIVGAMQDTIDAAMAVTDCDECGFNDLGRLLFGGLILAVIVGIMISLLRHRMNPDRPDFVSIRSSQKDK